MKEMKINYMTRYIKQSENKEFNIKVNGDIVEVEEIQPKKIMAEKLMSREEIRRLEKAVKDKNKMKLVEWMGQIQEQIIRDVEKQYNDSYRKEMGDSIDNFIVALAYTLWFSEETILTSKERLNELLKDLYATIDLYGTKEMNPIDYIEQLNDEGIDWFNEIAERRKHEN